MSAQLKPAAVLVVDDDDAGRYLKTYVLRRYGYDVMEAGNGTGAVALCHTAVPDIVVLDTKLPDMSGNDVCQRIKSRLPQVAVLQTSAAVGSARDRAQALEGGADAFLVEPIEPEELQASIKALLRMRRAEQELRRMNEQLEDLVAERTRELATAINQLDVEAAERRRAEDVLRHAQKLEAVGQLTGGIAHDFNNLLAVIVSSTAMLRAHLEGQRHYPHEKLLRLVSATEVAADRGGKLTQQMLTFARRGVLSTQVVVIDEVLAASESFLRRAVGEAVTLEMTPSAEPWACRIDPVQFETAILNLGVNAHDAMPSGGRLTISTANETVDEAASRRPDMPPPGEYVSVTIADTGLGMEPEVAKRAFEPFFTTKEVGKGTGLGLSQVYGFVTQSGGHVSLQSEVGVGTTFRVYLPRAEHAAPQPVTPEEATRDVPTGQEAILVVEDSPGVLELAMIMIGDLGYAVLAAKDGAQALDIIESGAPVDLLFTDVVMPGGISGFELVRRARELRPGLKALLTSGYAGVAAGDPEVPPLPMLGKPYARAHLAQRIRQVLDS